MSFMENMNLLTLVKISKYKSSHKLNRGLKSLDRLRGHLLFMSAHIRTGAVSGTECRRRSKGRGRRSEQRERGPFRALKMRPVRQEGVFMHRGPLNENASRTTGGCFWHRISLPYRRSLFFAPNASENASRTTGGLFEHGTHIPYHRRPSPVPNAGEGAEAGCRYSGAGCHISGEIIKS